MAFACTGYAAQSATTPLAPLSFQRRETGPDDVRIEILFCGVCHSDIHTARNEWRSSVYPVIPGHEIVGRVTEVGQNVTNFKVGDIAGVGCMVNSCRKCPSCLAGEEQYCEVGMTGTYNDPDKDMPGQRTYGGYSKFIVVDKSFVLNIPKNLDLAATAPLLCAGITTYSPLRHWKVSKGQKVGIVGLGGLGHMAVKFAKALGADVTLFTTSPSKVEDGKRLGAHHVVISKDEQAMKALGRSFDFILDAVAAPHDINLYFNLLRRDGTLVQVGAPDEPLSVEVFSLIFPRRNFAGSLIGGIAETQEMLNFCGEHNITADIEMIRMDQINDAYEKILASKVKYRFVIDMSTLPENA
ncbi:NAD(P)-dependent alcohol dehydrogenase [Entomobacter blattae]|uniref:NADP-dependent alcohol dehydrogenase C 1 n=1 Tax=Entomobacter blattae TaxID=2762277 RepID=A0A7H1NUZ0_9PROT|nr:NAD(P)-dependent alcohol dehydrogenase [Entomobacter blattae]QNT79600.1 NADP-dependent alcohol dehydrogenase C 1 [Entomobacter blattae]